MRFLVPPLTPATPRGRFWSRLPAALAVTALLLPLSCFGGGGSLSKQEAQTAGNFRAVSTNVGDGVVWQLNRPITLEFNHPVNPQSIGFGSIQIRARAGQGVSQPVTGTFSFAAGSDNRTIVFQPTCPTNNTNDNGALLPGGYRYELLLPTNAKFGNSILRDTGGHPLSVGLSRTFFTPRPPGEALFVDLNPGSPQISTVTWPERLNFFTDPEPVAVIEFDQAIDGRTTNLNTENLYIYYSDQPASAGPASFALQQKVPGSLLLAANCTGSGATVHFQIGGILPPDRFLQLVMTNGFKDITGQANSSTITLPLHRTPTLAQIYGDPSWSEEMETVDEFSDAYDSTAWIDPEAALTLPPAESLSGVMSASFDYPGQFVSADQDFYFNGTSGEIYTDGVTIFSDSRNRTHTVNNGVLYVDDFTVAASATLRARGSNPLVIYAQGTVDIQGTLNVSGNNSHWPTSLNSPQFPEGGAAGEAGGGRGGTASQITNAETPRGENGDGPFGLKGIGGVGGEGCFQQNTNIGGNLDENAYTIAGGGGGGTFAWTQNYAVNWASWSFDQRPEGVDSPGPDHAPGKHPYWPDGVFRDSTTIGFKLNQFLVPVDGGEGGLRGSSYHSERVTTATPYPDLPHGAYGMEDEKVDQVNPNEISTANFDPAWSTTTIPYDYGHPTNGPDGGPGGKSVFSPDKDTSNDFWGRRLNVDGSVTVGELLTPWAGSGGGASGDSMRFNRPFVNGAYTPLPDSYPTNPFPPLGGYYRKGAPGGGGGGQLLVMAIGPIILGTNANIKANGGIGHGGESVIYTYHQVSGAGGGSGGHVVLHSATEISFSAIYVGVANSGPELPTLTPAHRVQAIGGRRGWSGSALVRVYQSSTYDGNGDLMTGRGGAGGNGVIQVHVPDPGEDLIWPLQARNGIRSYIHEGAPGVKPANVDRVEEVLKLFCAPGPYLLLPFFSSGSQYQSRWVNTGLAALRDPQNPHGAGYEGPYPDYADSLLRFLGIDTASGKVQTTAGKVNALANVASGAVSAVTFGNTSLAVPAASSYFGAHFLRHPAALVGYDVLPDATNATASFEVVAAEYDRASDVLELTTRLTDGAMSFAVQPGNPWSVRQKFFRIATTGTKDGLPDSATVSFEFQGCDDPEDPQTYAPTPGRPNDWTANLALLKGKAFVRYRVSFDVDAQKTGVSQANPRPTVDYVKLPFVW